MLPLRRPQRLAAGVLLLAALAGCQQDGQPSTAAATTTSTVAPTTTSSVTAAERAWPAGVAKLRQRLDRVFLNPSRVILTRAKLREYILREAEFDANVALQG